MISYNDKNYQLVGELVSGKVYLLEDKKSRAKVVAKKSTDYLTEYKILKLIDDIPQTSSIVDYKDEILYIDYIENSQTLKQVIAEKQHLNIHSFYSLAFQIIDTLNKIHDKGIIHKDLSTSNILYVEKENLIYIIDFDISSLIKEKVDVNQSIEKLRAHFHFVSPEQTGRINRSIDFRSDFYSLGAVFYNLLIGRPPFIADDLIGVIHQHLSKKPTQLDQIDSKIPSILSKIILKLLNKEPEDRYQTLTGLKYDLSLAKSGKQDFKLGLNDRDHQLFIKHAHYDRDELITELRDLFNQTIKARNKLITIAGYSGTGKTSVIYELHKTLNIHFGFYAESKFNQFSNSPPYYGFVKVLDDYFAYSLKHSNSADLLREEVLRALGEEAFMLSNKIEHLEKLIGKQEEKSGFSAREEEIKFNKHFISLLKVITKLGPPIIFFIDDLQWADIGTITLIELVICCDEINNLLIINAYRDNEVDELHRYRQMLTRIESNTAYHPFFISNLSKQAVSKLMKDVVHNADSAIVDFVFDISSGNAFIINQLVDLLNNEKLIQFNYDSREFEYDIDHIKQIGLSKNIVDIATRNIKVLDTDVIELLKTASAIGNRFVIPLLSLVSDIDAHVIEDKLEQARQRNFLYLISGQYKFSHDRIQQAFYALNDEPKVAELHQKIAVTLDSNHLGGSIYRDRDLIIATHLNKIPHFLSDELRNRAVELNYSVAKNVKKSLAYEEAIKYLNAGLSLLDKSDKKRHWDYLFLKLEVYFISAKLQEMDELISGLEALIDSDEKAILLAKYVVNRGFMMGTHFESIDYGVKTIKQLGINIPSRANKLTVLKEFIKFKYHLRGKKYKQILTLPENKNKKMLLVTGLVYDLLNPSYMVSNDLYNSYALIASSIAVKYGNSKYSAYCYSTLSLLFGGVYKQFNTAEEIGMMAVKLGEKFYDLDSTSRANFIYGDFVLHGTKPFDEYIKYKEYSNKGFIQGGNILYRNCNEFFTVAQQTLFSPSALDQINRNCLDAHSLYKSSNDKALCDFQIYILSFLSRIRDGNIQAIIAQYDFDELEYSRKMDSEANLVLSSIYYTYRAIELYLFRQFDDAFDYINKAATRVIAQQGLLTDPIFRFFYCLCFLEKKGHTSRQKIEYFINKQLLKRHAKYSPQNFNAYYSLVLAQESAKNNKTAKAFRYFDKALRETASHGNAFHNGLAHELYGLFCLADNPKLARKKLTLAYQSYKEFKANAKAEMLKQEFGIDEIAKQLPIVMSSTLGSELDLNIVMKAAQTITEEVNVDEILKKMSVIILENLGANRGFIILQKGSRRVVYASITDDKCQVCLDVDIEDEAFVSSHIIDSVFSSKAVFISDNASKDSSLIEDEYVQTHQPKSILAVPMMRNNALQGVLYCENNLISGAFTQKNVDITFIIISQLVISLDNAFAYENLEAIVAERTRDLSEQKKASDAISLRLQLAAKASAIGIWEWDYATEYMVCDERTCEIFGLSAGDDKFPVSLWKALVDPSDLIEAEKRFSNALQTNSEYNAKYWITTPAGEKRYIQAIGIMEYDHVAKANRIVGTYSDLTDEKILQINLEKERNRFVLAIEGANDGLWDWDLLSGQLILSERFENMLGYDAGELSSFLSSWFSLLHPEDAFRTEKAVNNYLEKEQQGSFECRFRLRKKDGSWCWVLGRGKAQFSLDGKALRFVGFNTDITDQIEYQNKLDHSAKHDALTHLPNRFLLSELLTQSMNSVKRRKKIMALLFVDLDGFKAINDNYGHDVGDDVLVMVTSRMKKDIRSTDIVARIGGDEFVIVFSDLNNSSEIVPLVNKLLRDLAADLQIKEIVTQVTASIGISFYPQKDNIGNEVLLRQADQAMYSAKLAGKNQYQFYKLEENQELKEHQQKLSVLVTALQKEQFVLCYQPKVDMSKGKVIGFEALLRWNHPEHGIMYPDSFLNIVNEDPNYMNKLGQWVFKTAVLQLEKWVAIGHRFCISINVNAHELQYQGYLEFIKKTLNEHPNIAPEMIELELLETAAFDNFEAISDILRECQKIGLSIAIDDFGTGYASLHYLNALPFNTLKIDKSFVIGLFDGNNNISIIEAVIGLAHAFNANVIAEGVESIEQGNILLQLGCNLAQGYVISEAIPANAVENWLLSWHGNQQWKTTQVIDNEARELLFFAVEHIVWLNNIRLFIENKSLKLPSLDSQKCLLGRWLHSSGCERHEDSPNFKKLERLHNHLHEDVDHVLQMSDKDKSSEIQMLYAINGELLNTLNTFSNNNIDFSTINNESSLS